MGGGLLQLVAYGAQDVYLTGNPQITFFKVVYRRHTNFAIEAIGQTFNGTPGYGNRVTCQISRNGDLVHRMYLSLKVPDNKPLCAFYGQRVINYVEIEIGGQKIDKHYSHWLYVWNELSLPVSKRDGYNKMVGQSGGNLKDKTLYIPLEFWFCRNVGLALPLIALQYHEVKINIQFETAALCQGSGTELNAFPTATLWVDYVFLDTDERRRFAQLSHEYLIEQLQFTGSESVSSTKLNSKLSFNHPCKELIWFANKKADVTDQARTNNNWFNYTTAHNVINTLPYNYNENKLQNNAIASLNTIASAKLILNGNDRFSGRPGSYFNLIQPFQHHENIPANAGINVYSFALKPEEHQPSGTLNMSRIDTATLSLDFQSGLTENTTLNVYAINYNVLRILSGMGGLAYSN
uniref:Major capsid protein N-terminal domain-containing protein n=1 Tax=viral metagenome TaxID=1070528 RepID=A0A6C0LGU3_9ZZZZ